MNSIQDLLKRLVDWFLGKSQPKLETFIQEVIEGDGVTLIRYQRRTRRAYRTWKAVYKALDYDLIFGWDTLTYMPDVPVIHKKNRLSTHAVNIYKQGFHAKYNAIRKCHEPDIQVLLNDEACLDAAMMATVVQRWKLKTQNSPDPILTLEDIHALIIDEVAKYALRHPPREIEPIRIDWREVVRQTICVILGSDKHKVFPDENS